MGGAWKAALDEDTSAAYHRFLRDHPDSPFEQEARERLAFQRLRRSPTLPNYQKFLADYPDSKLVAELEDQIVTLAFDAARAVGTAEAYDRFLEEFPQSSFADRARGNASYLREGSFADAGSSPERLGALLRFADEFPASDFASEVRRSEEALLARDETGISSVELRIQLGPSTPESRRLLTAFSDVARKTYQAAGTRLLFASEISPRGPRPDGLLTIQHREDRVEAAVDGNSLSTEGIIATTRVTLTRRARPGSPVWQRTFSTRIESREHLAGRSLTFEPAGEKFWQSFFVPVVRWQSDTTLRPEYELPRRAAAVATVGDRAIVLAPDGSFEALNLADPAAPVVSSRYVRASDFRKFDQVEVLSPTRVMLFGEDGLELVDISGEPRAVYSKGRDEVGSVFGLAVLPEGLLIGSTKGLLLLPEGGEPTRIMRRVTLGLGAAGQTLVLSDGETVMISTFDRLRERRVLGQLKLGRTFGPGRVRIFGSVAVVLAEGGVITLDISDPSKPRAISQLFARNVGAVRDVAVVGRRMFLLGDRGLQLLSPRLDSVAEQIDLEPDARVTPLGRHLVAVGGTSLQVLDTTAFTFGAIPAGVKTAMQRRRDAKRGTAAPEQAPSPSANAAPSEAEPQARPAAPSPRAAAPGVRPPTPPAAERAAAPASPPAKAASDSAPAEPDGFIVRRRE